MAQKWGKIATTSAQAEQSSAVIVQRRAKKQGAAESCLKAKDARIAPIANTATIANGQQPTLHYFARAPAQRLARTSLRKTLRKYARPARLP